MKNQPRPFIFILQQMLAVSTALALLGLISAPAEASKEKQAKKNKDARQVTSPSADVAVPHIAYVFPAGGQRGTSVEATVGGQGFLNVRTVHVCGEGVKATVAKAVDDKTFRISVTIAADAPLGERELRVVTPSGASNRFRFIAGQLPEVIEAEPNSKQDQAQRLGSLPVTVNGQVFGADSDFYRFPAKAGDKLVLQVQARSLLPFIADAVPGWMQPTLTLYDSAGRELAYVDDFRFDPDPVLVFSVPKDGDYIAEIKDALFRGREDFVYRLSIGELPFITDIYPLGAKRGAAAKIDLHGANLSAKSVAVKLPEDCPTRWPVSLTAKGLASNVLPLATGELEEVGESEPNDSQAQANKIRVPVTVNGRIGRPGDSDFFTFTGQKGQELVIEVYARRLGSPLDSVLTLLDSKGAQIARNDDTVDPTEPMITHQADSRLAWKSPAAGDYVVRIADAQEKGGEEYAYRLTIAPPQPDFALRVLPDNPRITPGDTAVLTAEAVRKDGFDGEVRLSLMGLPGGWSLRAATIPANETQARFTLTAPVDAAPGLVSPTIMGTASVAGKEVVRKAWPAEEVMQAFSYQHRVATQEFLLAVVEGGFFTLAVDLPPGGAVEVPQGGEATLVVKASRKKGADAPIRLALDGPPKGISMKYVTIPPDNDEAAVTITAAQTTVPGSAQNLIITGILKAGKGSITRFAPAIPIRIVPGNPTTATAPATAPATQKTNQEQRPRKTKGNAQ